MEILYTPGSIHSRIKQLFVNPSRNDKRIIIVAFIGQDVKSFLPSPRGITIICNPNPVATSVEAISYLKQCGAKVMFSNSLHMKVYYSKERGCIITSANLSNNALGSGRLKEMGVFIPAGQVDIDRIIKIARPYKVTSKALIEMDQRSKKINTALKNVKVNLNKDKQVEFGEWYQSREHKVWKMSAYNYIDVPFAKLAVEQTKMNYGKKEPYSIMNLEKNQLKVADWLLCFRSDSKAKISNIEWMYIDFYVPVSKKEKGYDKDWPVQYVQVNPASKYPPPPFKLTPEFRQAFKKAAIEYGIEKLEDRTNLTPPVKFIEMIKEYYK